MGPRLGCPALAILCDNRRQVVAASSGGSATAPVSHQKRPQQDNANAIELETAAKSTNLTVILPLITVWLQAFARRGSGRFLGCSLAEQEFHSRFLRI